MTYTKDTQALAAMAAMSERSAAPALAVVCDDRTYRVVEADEDGVFVILRAEHVIDTMWTLHSAGITELTVENAYSIGCYYKTNYASEQTFRVPHGAEDLGHFLDSLELGLADHACDSFSQLWTRGAGGRGGNPVPTLAGRKFVPIRRRHSGCL